MITYRSGLIVHEHYFWLGASPDRKMYDNQTEPPYGLVEVVYLGKIENILYLKGRWQVLFKTISQILQTGTGQMTLAGADWCDFLVYSNAGMLIIWIELDHAFSQIDLFYLSEFYFKYYMPVLAK